MMLYKVQIALKMCINQIVNHLNMICRKLKKKELLNLNNLSLKNEILYYI